MDNATAIGIKFAVVALLTAFVLPAVARVSYGQSLLLAAVYVAISYPIGDLRALRRWGNTVAVLVDLGIATLLFRYSPLYLTGATVGWEAALAAGGAIAGAEILIHTYVQRTVLLRR